jgi:hypothetical protein
MKLKTLIENLKYYKSIGSSEVTLDINDLLEALQDVSKVDEIKPKKSLTLNADGGKF